MCVCVGAMRCVCVPCFVWMNRKRIRHEISRNNGNEKLIFRCVFFCFCFFYSACFYRMPFDRCINIECTLIFRLRQCHESKEEEKTQHTQYMSVAGLIGVETEWAHTSHIRNHCNDGGASVREWNAKSQNAYARRCEDRNMQRAHIQFVPETLLRAALALCIFNINFSLLSFPSVR